MAGIMNEIADITLTVDVIQGRNLVAKDKNIITRKKTSDPYVVVLYKGKKYGKTQVIYKNLSPTWNNKFIIKISGAQIDGVLQGHEQFKNLSLHVFDEDKVSSDDFMGEAIVNIPFQELFASPQILWYPVGTGSGSLKCKKATGEIQVKLSLKVNKILKIVSGNTTTLPCMRIRVSLQWMIEAGQNTDLDTSCVSIDKYGNVLMDQTVYFGNLANPNRSIRHSGDALVGGAGETIDCDLDSVPKRVLAIYFLATVATPGKTFKDVTTASVNIMNTSLHTPMFRFVPSASDFGKEYTAMFLMRVTRQRGGNWSITIIEDMEENARDFGSLIPEIKGYSRDICPGIAINPKERVAIMRKGGVIRVKDYSNGAHDQRLVFGLAWDVTNGQNIDLDTSAICLDSSMQLVEIIYFKNLTSSNASIRHGGDEREGDEEGDDEKIFIDLDRVQSNVKYVGFVVTSYSGQELDDISQAACHLFNASTNKDLAKYQVSNDKYLDKHTGLVMACLYRDSNEWNLRIIGKAAQGRVPHKLVDELQNVLRVPAQAPISVPEPEIVVNAMPESLPMSEEEIVVNPFVPSVNSSPVKVPQTTSNTLNVPVPFVP